MKILSFSSALIVAMTLLVSCSDDNSNTPTPPAPLPDVMLKETTLGKVLADSSGRTLYYFSKDAAGTSVCTGNCEVNWPVFSTSDLSGLDPALNTADFGTITRADGKPQTTYKGWPLYYFKNDAAAGEVKGEGVGGIWFVAKTDYTVMITSAQLVGMDGKSYKSDLTEGTGETIFFTDGMGRTLYAFANDKKNKNNFTKNDATHDASWPIYATDIATLPSTLDKTLFGTIDVFGKKQLTYKGWPLYYFGPDNMTRGLTKGVSVPKPGVWPVVNQLSPVAPD